MKSPTLIIFLLSITLFHTGCVGPGYPPLASADIARYAILEVDARSISKLADHAIVDFASIDGFNSDTFTNRRIERDSDGKLSKVFILLEPRRYTLTLRYTKAFHHLAGWEFLYGDITYDYDLGADIYRIDSSEDDKFVYLSLKNSKGQKVGVDGKSVFKLASSPSIYVPTLPTIK